MKEKELLRMMLFNDYCSIRRAGMMNHNAMDRLCILKSFEEDIKKVNYQLLYEKVLDQYNQNKGFEPDETSEFDFEGTFNQSPVISKDIEIGVIDSYELSDDDKKEMEEYASLTAEQYFSGDERKNFIDKMKQED